MVERKVGTVARCLETLQTNLYAFDRAEDKDPETRGVLYWPAVLRHDT
jgi:hypothetical protein